MPSTFILDKDTFQPLALIEDYQQITWKRRMWGAGNFEMQINQNKFSASQLEKGQLIGISLTPTAEQFDNVYLVEQIEYNAGPTIVDEVLNVSGRDMSAYIEDRIAVPPPMEAYLSVNDAATESAMKFYVNVSLASGAATERQVPNLFVVTDQARGNILDYDARFQKISDILEELGRFDDIGWQIFFDPDTNTFQFDVIIGANRTIGADFPVIFDFQFQNVKTQKLLRTDFDRKTLAYVAGQGEGAARSVILTWIPSFAPEPEGFDRRELFVDARDLNNNVQLALRGTAKLAETIFDEAVEIEINGTSPQQYRVDWDLGDVVTVRNEKWNFTKNMRIIEVTNTITPQLNAPITQIALDRVIPRYESRIRRGLSQFDAGRRF